MTQRTRDRYPERWEADVVLRDGGTAVLRPIRPDDGELLVEFYARVSDRSKYLRFFAPYPRLSVRDVKRFTEVDHNDRVALIMTVKEEMIAVGRYDRTAPVQAEVAFLVRDDHQRRGVGSVLLEHLAQAARENGIERFEAEVLPENHQMTAVFSDAGYQSTGGYEDGVIRLEFRIEPTRESLDVTRSREHRAEARSVERLLTPRTVAVIGASRSPEKLGQALVRNLVLGGFTGPVYAVNPATRAVAGVPSYDSLDDVPSDVDLAVVVVPAEQVPKVVMDSASNGVHGLLVVSSGFAESGRDGRERQRELVRRARAYGLRVIGPNALGLVNTDPNVRLNASPAPVVPGRGPLGFFCQSGALGTVVLETLVRRGIGLSTFVSAGNRADVSGNDLLQYWEDDDATSVVLLYLESLGNPRKFSRIASRVSATKPIVAVRSGRFSQGVPLGHSVHGADVPAAAVDAMFRQAGVILVDRIEEMLDVAQVLANQPLPKGSGIGLVGNSDALATLAADTAAEHGLSVVRELAVSPVDPTGADYASAFRELVSDSAVDVVLAMYASPVEAGGADIARAITDAATAAADVGKPVLATFLGKEGMLDAIGPVPSYATPRAAVRALGKVTEYVRWLSRPRGAPPALDGIDVEAAQALAADLLAGSPGGTTLTSEQSRKLLATYGIQLWPDHLVRSVEQAVEVGTELGWDVVLKATDPRLRQRPDLADVQRDIRTPDDMVTAWAALVEHIGAADFVVQKSAPPGVPVYLAAVEDPMFGPVTSFGLAGVATDLLGDLAYRIPPLTDVDAVEMVREVRAAPLLFGQFGGEQVDIGALEELLHRLARLSYDVPELASAELLPVLAGREGAAVLGAAIQLAPAAAAPRTDTYVRRLT